MSKHLIVKSLLVIAILSICQPLTKSQPTKLDLESTQTSSSELTSEPDQELEQNEELELDPEVEVFEQATEQNATWTNSKYETVLIRIKRKGIRIGGGKMSKPGGMRTGQAGRVMSGGMGPRTSWNSRRMTPVLIFLMMSPGLGRRHGYGSGNSYLDDVYMNCTRFSEDPANCTQAMSITFISRAAICKLSFVNVFINLLIVVIFVKILN